MKQWMKLCESMYSERTNEWTERMSEWKNVCMIVRLSEWANNRTNARLRLEHLREKPVKRYINIQVKNNQLIKNLMCQKSSLSCKFRENCHYSISIFKSSNLCRRVPACRSIRLLCHSDKLLPLSSHCSTRLCHKNCCKTNTEDY